MQQQFLRLTDEQRYDEAQELAQQVLDLTIRAYGERHIEVATPLSNLATVQMHRGDLTAAETNYQAAIALIEQADGILSPRLINPLIGLGATYNRAGLYPQAEEAYQRALRVNHAQQGFYNFEQFKIRDGLTETYLGLGKLEEANFQQQTQVAIQRRKHGEGNPELVPAIEKLARWYDRTGQYAEARLQWQTARRLLREARGPRDPALVEVLMGEAQSYESEALLPSAVRSLKDALEILDAQPDRDHLKRAEVLVALGDLYLAYNKSNSAKERYIQAWQELSASEEFREQRDRYFAKPRRVSGRPLDKVVGDDAGKGPNPRSRPELFAQGYVVVNLGVDEEGRVQAPKIVESEPPGLMDRQVLDVLGSSRFRPRMDSGDIVRSDDVVFRHDFRYRKAAAAARREGPGNEAEQNAGKKGAPIAYPEPQSGDAPAQAPESTGD